MVVYCSARVYGAILKYAMLACLLHWLKYRNARIALCRSILASCLQQPRYFFWRGLNRGRRVIRLVSQSVFLQVRWHFVHLTETQKSYWKLRWDTSFLTDCCLKSQHVFMKAWELMMKGSKFWENGNTRKFKVGFPATKLLVLTSN